MLARSPHLTRSPVEAEALLLGNYPRPLGAAVLYDAIAQVMGGGGTTRNMLATAEREHNAFRQSVREDAEARRGFAPPPPALLPPAAPFGGGGGATAALPPAAGADDWEAERAARLFAHARASVDSVQVPGGGELQELRDISADRSAKGRLERVGADEFGDGDEFDGGAYVGGGEEGGGSPTAASESPPRLTGSAWEEVEI